MKAAIINGLPSYVRDNGTAITGDNITPEEVEEMKAKGTAVLLTSDLSDIASFYNADVVGSTVRGLHRLADSIQALWDASSLPESTEAQRIAAVNATIRTLDFARAQVESVVQLLGTGQTIAAVKRLEARFGQGADLTHREVLDEATGGLFSRDNPGRCPVDSLPLITGAERNRTAHDAALLNRPNLGASGAN